MDNEYLAGLFDAEGMAEISLGQKRSRVFGIQAVLRLSIGLSTKYFAGLFDGDGWASISLNECDNTKFGLSSKLGINISSKTHPLLVKLKQIYGGSLS